MSLPVLDSTLPALWLVRHGESTWNIAGLAQGHNDEAELTDGVLEGTANQTIGSSVTGLADGLVIDPDARPPAGESVRDLYARAAAFCDDLVPGLGDRLGEGTGEGGDVLIVAHGGTVRVLDAYLHGVPVDQMTWRPVDNAAVVRIPDFGTRSRGGNR